MLQQVAILKIFLYVDMFSSQEFLQGKSIIFRKKFGTNFPDLTFFCPGLEEYDCLVQIRVYQINSPLIDKLPFSFFDAVDSLNIHKIGENESFQKNYIKWLKISNRKMVFVRIVICWSCILKK